ncbi:MAG: OmpA family protein [Luteolibacter sp.]|jgi:outer membrane protein OmpA-like peptidoglycan-associated protein|nr:OmpA family protein [Luteolibacter sp.]
MADGYSWSELRDGGTYRLPGPEHIGWWAAVAMLLSILMHVAVFLVLDRMKIALRFEQARELSTGSINVRQVEVRPMDAEQAAPPEDLIIPPKDAASLLEEVDLLDALPKDQEIDIKPDIEEAQYALKMQAPALAGDPAAIAMEVSAGLEIDADLPELGRELEALKPAEVGQVTVDPGAVRMDDSELGKFTEEMIKRGANGSVERGALDGIASLDDLLDLPPNILLASKTMLPSDLLFEFNSTELRESAKVGLMKLALLMDRNPNLFCWIEGHTDLVGGDEFNLDLSIRRAETVKRYLVESMRMNASKIITRGFGRYEPLVIAGGAGEQAANRRVEIRMRKTPPSEGQMKIAPKKAAVVVEAPAQKPRIEEVPPVAPVVVEAPPPKAVLVKPQRALPVEEAPAPPLRAQPVEE